MKLSLAFIIVLLYIETYPQSGKAIKLRVKDEFIVASIWTGNVRNKANFHSEYYWYSEQQVKRNVGGHYGQLLNGDYKRFDRSNNMVESGCFKKGRKVGSWISWYENGNLRELSHWRKGLLHGEQIEYNSEGIAVQKSIYKKGDLIKQQKLDSLNEETTEARGFFKRLAWWKKNQDGKEEVL